MATFQGPTTLAPGMQVGAQPVQRQIMSDISIQAVPQQARQRQLTADTIRRRSDAAKAKGPNNYWQVAAQGRPLKLTTAIDYVTSPERPYANRVGNQRFVYWPKYAVAGTVEDIVRAFRATGDPEFTALTEQQVIAEAWDPLNPLHLQHLQNVKTEAGSRGGGGRSRQQPRYTLEEYIMVSEAIKASTKGASTVNRSITSTGTGTGRGGGGKDPESNRARLIQEFEQLMLQASQLPAGQDLPRILNVTNFDSQRFTKATNTKPSSGPRATAIRPSIVVGNRRIAVPISSQPGGVANFEAYVREIIGRSQYAQYGQEILQSFREQLMQRQPSGPAVSQSMMMPQQVLGLQQQTLPTGFQAQPTMNVMQQLQQQMGAASPGSPGSPGSISPRSPRSPQSSGTASPVSPRRLTMPTFGAQPPQLPSLSVGAGGPQLPSLSVGAGGPQLPNLSVGAGGPQLPNLSVGAGGPQLPGAGGPQLPGAGGPQLPSIGRLQLPAGGTNFPTIPVPGQQ